MQQIVYAMHFQGKATPAEGETGVFRVHAAAVSSSITSVVNSGGITGGFDPSAVADANFESRVTTTPGKGFEERGTIAFGSGGHRLRFKTLGAGWMGPSADSRLQQGTVTWELEEGEGQLAGAQGLITSNFTITYDGEVNDYHLGVLYLK